MHVRFSDRAEAALDHIHISERHPAAANRIVDALLSAAYQLELFWFLGRPGRADDTRELSVPHPPYFIVYTLPDQYHVDIEAIFYECLNYP